MKITVRILLFDPVSIILVRSRNELCTTLPFSTPNLAPLVQLSPSTFTPQSS